MRKLSFTDAELKVAAQEAWEAMAVSLSDINHNELEIPSGFRDRIMQMAKQYWEKEESEKRQRRKRALLRAAAIFIAILLGASAFFAVNTEARAVVQDWFREVYERLVVYRFGGEPKDETLPVYEPTWLPNGYQETKKIIDDENKVALIVYRKEGVDAGIVFEYSYYEDSPMGVEPQTAEELIYEKGTVNGRPADCYYESDPTAAKLLIWIDEEQQLIFSISSVLEKNDIYRIAESIYRR